MALFMANFFLCPSSLICHVTINSAVHIAVKEPSCMSYLRCLYTGVQHILSNMACVLWEAGTAYPSRAPGFILVLVGSVLLVVCACCHAFLFFFGLPSSCLVYPMLPIAPDCPFLIAAKRRDAFIEMASLFLSGLICCSLWYDSWERFLIKTWK